MSVYFTDSLGVVSSDSFEVVTDMIISFFEKQAIQEDRIVDDLYPEYDERVMHLVERSDFLESLIRCYPIIARGLK